MQHAQQPTGHVALAPVEFSLDVVAGDLPQVHHRSFSGTSTTQAEALPPDVLAAVLKAAITSRRDVRVLAALLEREEDERRRLLDGLGYDPDAD